MPVIVLAHIFAKEGRETEVLEVLRSQVGPTLKEEGCINYDLHRSIDDPKLFMFHETWTSREALNAHSKSQHILSSREKTKDLLERPSEITLWDAL